MAEQEVAEANGVAMGPSLAEVATASDVSVATVSRVLNGKAGVREDLRLRVLRAAERLGYRPLRRSRKHVASGGKPDTHFQFTFLSEPAVRAEMAWSPAFLAASGRLQTLGHTLHLQFVKDPVDADMQRLKANERALLEDCQGVMSAHQGFFAWLKEARRLGRPAVRLGYYPTVAAVPQVVGDSFTGSLKLMDYLIKKGHKRIAVWRTHVTPFDGSVPLPMNEREKYAAYRLALHEAGIEYRPELEVRMNFDWRQVQPLARRLLSVRPAPTALFIDNDWTTARAMNYPVKEEDTLPAGWHREFEVVHFIDTGVEPSRHGLTCVALPMDRMGEQGAEMLLAQTHGVVYPPDHVVKLAPRFLTAEELMQQVPALDR
ncbi:MAG: LacI family DNA-binding transcriptional regulator [Planctomycetes bacterium]|nr:LacI family DNA-binding transcriptional regulator [Planctomycetota bacterium]